MNEKRKTAVIYRTMYGSSKKYAEWIAQEVQGDLFDGAKFNPKDFDRYDTVVFGGSLYAVGILGFDLIKNNFERLKSKKVIVYTVGASPAYPEAVESVRQSNFSEEMKKTVHYFHLRGGFDYKRLNLVHKVMMLLLKRRIKKKKPEVRNRDEIGMLASYDKPMDWTSKKAIAPIVDCILK
ncbi:MAG: flavodoxin domain-containing protein [Clostridia bacterium]|nr:flavodoxin domain-containing protein [Clostridia bacterium]